MRRYYSKVRIAHAPAGTLLEMVDGVWCLTKGASKVLLAFGKDFDPDMWSGDFEEVTQGFEAIDTVKESTEEDHIADVGEKVDEVPDEICLPKMFFPTKSYDIVDCLKDRDEATYKLIKAVNYLLKKQR